jgi:hypothetical protein
MLSIERTKEMIDPNMSDQDAADIRDACRALAEVIFEQWQFERARNIDSDQYDETSHST